MALESFCKLVCEGRGLMGLSREGLEAEIRKRAEAVRQPGQSSAQAFSRYITERDDGRLLFKTSRLIAPVPPAPQDEVEDYIPGNPKHSPAGIEMQRLVDAHQLENPKLSRAQSFARVIDAANNRAVAARVLREQRGVQL
jgi:hypothetical protein